MVSYLSERHARSLSTDMDEYYQDPSHHIDEPLNSKDQLVRQSQRHRSLDMNVVHCRIPCPSATTVTAVEFSHVCSVVRMVTTNQCNVRIGPVVQQTHRHDIRPFEDTVRRTLLDTHRRQWSLPVVEVLVIRPINRTKKRNKPFSVH
jgi:hypothetical protein